LIIPDANTHRHHAPRWQVVLLCLLLAGCADLPLPGATTSPPGSTVAPPGSSAIPTEPDPAQPHSGWTTVGPGIEYRRILADIPNHNRQAPVHIVRLDQQAVQFRVGYTSAVPRPLAEWCNAEGVVAAINGGFFEADYQTTALVISDGVAYGSSYQNQGGMFAVDRWGNVSLRYLLDMPYDPNEPLQQAIQGWPMLVRPGGGPLAFSETSGQRARRSVIAMDRSGNVLLMAFPGSDFLLDELATWLLTSDLAIDSALNLDGGSSTGLCVRTESYQERIDAFVPLPTALQVRLR
jgi:uncharacterized protein YigE (DUF2233 family)